ncbi:MAG: universal stress protein, partial [Planctomycetota bacterium]|nr:universal stress protein [Planctomycetota bacterium]
MSMDTLKSLVVAIDFTDGSKAALAEAVRIAKWNRASLRAVHVVESLVLADLEEALGGADPDLRENVLEDTRKAWREFATSVPGSESVEFDLRVDQPSEGVASAVEASGADLLVMGLQGTGEGNGAGTVATHAVRRSRVKTMLVRQDHTGPFRRIVVAVDFSPTSREALFAAMRLASQDDAEVHAVHVFNPPWLRLHYRSATPQAAPDYRKQFMDALSRRIESFCAPDDPETRWVKPTFHVLENRNHGYGIVEFAVANGADLVALGTRGRANLRDFFL